MAPFCGFHSGLRDDALQRGGEGIAICPFPESGEQHCHQCNKPVPPETEAGAIIKRSVRYCSQECAVKWSDEHPRYWSTNT